MKKTLLIVLPLLLIVGCSKEPINENSLLDRNGVKYQQDSQKPYSGKVFRLYENGEKKLEGSYKDGKKDKLLTVWYENGQKMSEKTYKDGKDDGLYTTWYENGQKKDEGIYKDGNRDGVWTEWYENGQKKEEGTWKDGELIEESFWDRDGTEY